MGSSGTFDESKAYAPQAAVFFDDGREIELLHYVYSRPNLQELRGCPEKILAAIDEFGRTRKYLMNVGEDKGGIITRLIAETRPRVMVELGGYVGYSAILFSNAVNRAGGQQYICLERNPEFAAVASSLIELAELSFVTRVIVGSSSDSLKRLHSEGLSRIDLLFLDHYKPAYLPDLQLCEQLGLIQPKSVLAADNVIKPGNPPYLEYVRKSSMERKKLESAPKNAANKFDAKSTRQYEQRLGTESLDPDLRGDPSIIYESELFKSFEPTGIPDGIEITRCVGRAP